MSNELTYERLIEVLDYNPETGIFTWRKDSFRHVKEGKVAGSSHGDMSYCRITIDRRRYFAHRLAWFYVNKSHPVNMIDHINCIKTDNRICNLRQADRFINSQNIKAPDKTNKSGYLGVCWNKDRKKWHSKIHFRGKNYTLGWFLDPIDAHEAYLKAKREFHEGCTI